MGKNEKYSSEQCWLLRYVLQSTSSGTFFKFLAWKFKLRVTIDINTIRFFSRDITKFQSNNELIIYFASSYNLNFSLFRLLIKYFSWEQSVLFHLHEDGSNTIYNTNIHFLYLFLWQPWLVTYGRLALFYSSYIQWFCQ